MFLCFFFVIIYEGNGELYGTQRVDFYNIHLA